MPASGADFVQEPLDVAPHRVVRAGLGAGEHHELCARRRARRSLCVGGDPDARQCQGHPAKPLHRSPASLVVSPRPPAGPRHGDSPGNMTWTLRRDNWTLGPSTVEAGAWQNAEHGLGTRRRPEAGRSTPESLRERSGTRVRLDLLQRSRQRERPVRAAVARRPRKIGPLGDAERVLESRRDQDRGRLREPPVDRRGPRHRATRRPASPVRSRRRARSAAVPAVFGETPTASCSRRSLPVQRPRTVGRSCVVTAASESAG